MTRRTDVVAVACASGQAHLGDGIRWDARRDELVWVDSGAGLAHRARIGRGGGLKLVCTYHLPGRPTAIVPVEADEGWLVALERGIHLLRADGSTLELAVVAPVGARLKDAACDARGRLWVGSMAEDHVTPLGALYRLEQDGEQERVVDALVVPDGIGWSPEGTTMYVTDSGSQLVYSFAFDVESGVLADRQILLSFEGVEGTPDGITVDVRGDIWIAVHGGYAVRRDAADGTLLAVFPVPAPHVNSCAFGGRDLRSLYVMTGTDARDADERTDDRAAGLLYRVDADARGRPALPFRPNPRWWARIAPAAPPQAAGEGTGYEIVVMGGHGSMLEGALPEFEVTTVGGGRAHIVGNVVDQAALLAALHRLQDLHLEVLELHRLSDR